MNDNSCMDFDEWWCDLFPNGWGWDTSFSDDTECDCESGNYFNDEFSKT